jgi:hypothetical protein
MNDPEQSKALVTTEIRVPATLDLAAGSANPFGRAIVVPPFVARRRPGGALLRGSIENDRQPRGVSARVCVVLRATKLSVGHLHYGSGSGRLRRRLAGSPGLALSYARGRVALGDDGFLLTQPDLLASSDLCTA